MTELTEFAAIRCGEEATAGPYVDKTAYACAPAQNNQPRLLCRPMGFGKTTLLSTVQELFVHGLKPHFKGLKAQKLWKEKQTYSVLRLNFECSSRDCGDLPGFKKYFAECLEKFAASQGFALKTGGGNLSESFAELFKLQRPRSLVLLIDDYDALLCAVCREEEAEQLRALLQELFAHIKTHADKLRCVFITGEHSLKDSGLDAAALNITDITLDPRFAACCGCSIEEQLKYAHPDVDCELLEMLHGLYGNYSFDPTLMTKVMPGRALEDLPTTFSIRGLNFTWQEALRWGLTGEFDGRTHTARELWALGYLTLS